MYKYRWKPSKTAAREFKEKMSAIEEFCIENGITMSANGDSYYFTIDGQHYRVSNHSIEASNAKAYNFYGEKVRECYHDSTRDPDVIYIHAGKTRIIEIYNNLRAGKKLDGRGQMVDCY